MDGPWWTVLPEETPGAKSMSRELVTQFLNETVYPTEGDETVDWMDAVKAFQEWKRRNGHFYGNMTDLKNALVAQYGRPPWADIRLKMESLP
jgi:hypothetical protein